MICHLFASYPSFYSLKWNTKKFIKKVSDDNQIIFFCLSASFFLFVSLFLSLSLSLTFCLSRCYFVKMSLTCVTVRDPVNFLLLKQFLYQSDRSRFSICPITIFEQKIDRCKFVTVCLHLHFTLISLSFPLSISLSFFLSFYFSLSFSPSLSLPLSWNNSQMMSKEIPLRNETTGGSNKCDDSKVLNQVGKSLKVTQVTLVWVRLNNNWM